MFKNYFQKNKKAFTLVELLVVIAIIGILATLAVVALQQARSRARDSKRVADVKQTQTALELFFNEQGRYPTVEEWNSGALITSSGEMLMIDIPSAPYPADGVCDASQNTFYYQVDDDYSSYSISFCLGSDVSSLSEGPKCATPGGILDYDCSGGSVGGEDNPVSTVCYPDCQAGYICQSGSCVVDTFECGQNVVYNGHTYPTVAIGEQCWFKENLRTDKFKNGDSIPRISGSWSGTTIPSWVSFHSNSSYYPVYDFYSTIESYGYAYSSHAVIDPRGLCPEGWKIASRDDYVSVTNLSSYYDAFSVRSCRQVDSPLGGSCLTDEHPRWSSNSNYGTDDLGLSLLPGGNKYSTTWNYFGTGYFLWTSTPNIDASRLYEIYNTGNSVIQLDSTTIVDSIYGRYVRCVKKTDNFPKTVPEVSTNIVNNITANTAFSEGSIVNDGGSVVYSKGFVWSENNNPLIGDSNSKFITLSLNSSPFSSNIFYGLQAGKTYYIRAYAVNEVGVGYGNVLSFTTTDPCLGLSSVSYNGHTYPTVAIGEQCWFKENLISDKFKNGDSIPRVSGSWGSTISSWISYHSNPSYYPAYDFFSTYGNLYGYVYSSHTITDPRGVCPEGWMVPTRDDFISLMSNIGAYNVYNLRSCRQVNSPLGGECTTSELPCWASDTVYGTDDLGFSLLPGGHKYSTQWPYFGSGFWLWTSTANSTGSGLYYIYNTGGPTISTSSTVPIDSIYGRYIRCIKKTDLFPKTVPIVTTSPVNNISATRAFSGGTITNDGGSIVHSGGVVWSENSNPLIDDGNSKFSHSTLSSTSFVSDVFYGLEPGKTYYIRAYAVNEVGVGYGNVLSFTTTDPCLGLSSVSYNGYNYPTVAIGEQCWFKENLISDKFKNGDFIPRVSGSWSGTNYPLYDFLSTYGNLYGYVYSSHAIIDPRGICPEGWMVPTRDDFISLMSNIGAYNVYNLRSCRQVNSPLGGECTTSELPCWASDTVYGTDDLGFSLLPGGHKYSTQWPYFGSGFWLWTRTVDDLGTSLYYIYNTGGSTISTSSTVPIDSIYGRYIRCIKE